MKFSSSDSWDNPESAPAPQASLLVAPAVDGGTDQTPTELALAAIWRDILGMESIDRDANFLALSGDSLQSLQLLLRVEECFGKQLDMTDLYGESATLRRLARLIDGQPGEAPAAQCGTALLLQPGQGGPALFCSPCIFGSLWEFQKLARYLGPDQRVYGLQTPGLDGIVEPCQRIDQLAEHYVREMRRVQPVGPYYLAGYSFGGTVAYEMARRLHGEGEQVALLAMLDPPARGRSRFFRVFHRLTKPMIKRGSRIARRLRLWLQGQNADAVALDPFEDPRHPPGRQRVFVTNRRALDLYAPQPYDGAICLFRASVRPPWPKRMYDDTTLEWLKLAQGDNQILYVPGGHQEFFRDGHIEVLAARLRECLDAAWSDHQPAAVLPAQPR